MAKCKAKVLKTDITFDRKFVATVEMNGRLPKVGDVITCSWGKGRTVRQNNLLWCFLTYCFDDLGLKDEGYFAVEGLHEDLKAALLSKRITDKNGLTKTVVGSTTDFSVDEMRDYVDKVDTLICQTFGVSSQPFWIEYARMNSKS